MMQAVCSFVEEVDGPDKAKEIQQALLHIGQHLAKAYLDKRISSSQLEVVYMAGEC